jgi:hypothetical protein
VRRGTQLVPSEMLIFCWKTCLPKYVVNKKTQTFCRYQFQWTFVRIRVNFYKIRFVPSWNKILVSMCSSSCQFVPLFVWSRLHVGASQWQWEEASSPLFHVPLWLYRWCPFIYYTSMIVGAYILLNLKYRTTQIQLGLLQTLTFT